jgi:hypothetical protein
MARKIVCEGKVFCCEGDLNGGAGCLNCWEGELNTCEGWCEQLRRRGEQGHFLGQSRIAYLSMGQRLEIVRAMSDRRWAMRDGAK